MKYLIGIDVGTSGTKSTLFDLEGIAHGVIRLLCAPFNFQKKGAILGS